MQCSYSDIFELIFFLGSVLTWLIDIEGKTDCFRTISYTLSIIYLNTFSMIIRWLAVDCNPLAYTYQYNKWVRELGYMLGTWWSTYDNWTGHSFLLSEI